MKPEIIPRDGTESKGKTGLAKAIMALKPDSNDCLRLSTAREGRNFAGLYTVMRRRGYQMAARYDGEDMLVWVITKK